MIIRERNKPQGGIILLFFVLINVVVLEHAFVKNAEWYQALMVTFPLLIVAGFMNKKRPKINSDHL